jgi:hypothetical protein
MTKMIGTYRTSLLRGRKKRKEKKKRKKKNLALQKPATSTVALF